jgi:hypothetical protein
VLDLLAPEVGLEPTTLRLTAECSAIELLRSVLGRETPTRCASTVITNADSGVKGQCEWGMNTDKNNGTMMR